MPFTGTFFCPPASLSLYAQAFARIAAEMSATPPKRRTALPFGAPM